MLRDVLFLSELDAERPVPEPFECELDEELLDDDDDDDEDDDDADDFLRELLSSYILEETPGFALPIYGGGKCLLAHPESDGIYRM